MADAADLKSAGDSSPCRFESGPRQTYSQCVTAGNTMWQCALHEIRDTISCLLCVSAVALEIYPSRGLKWKHKGSSQGYPGRLASRPARDSWGNKDGFGRDIALALPCESPKPPDYHLYPRMSNNLSG